MVKSKTKKSAKERGHKLVSFEMDAETWKAFRRQALESDIPAAQLLRDLIRTELSAKKPGLKKKT